MGKKKIQSILAITLLILTGCAKPGPLLEGVGTLMLVKGERVVEVENDVELAISWSVDGQYYGSWARGRDGEVPVMVRLVEANAGFVRVRAEAWKSVELLPWSYLRAPGIKVAARSGRYERPTVSIPVEEIDEVQVFDFLAFLDDLVGGDADLAHVLDC